MKYCFLIVEQSYGQSINKSIIFPAFKISVVIFTLKLCNFEANTSSARVGEFYSHKNAD